MSNNQHNAPKGLIEARGVYAGQTDLVGKKIRITSIPEVDPIVMRMMGGLPFNVGCEGTIILADAEGALWADFGDDERVQKQGPEQVRIQSVGDVDPDRVPAGLSFDVIDGETEVAKADTDSFQVSGPATLQ